MDDEVHAERLDAAEEGIELLRDGETERAIAALGRLAVAQADNEYAHFFLGNAHYAAESFERALACYVRALELAPRYLGARVGAGHALRMLGDHERALRMGKEALALAKDDPDALYLVGVVLFQRGDNAAARAFLKRFLETGPELEVALEVEGMLQVIRGEIAPAHGGEEDDAE